MYVRLDCLLFAVLGGVGLRPPWLPASRTPHDREMIERALQAEMLSGSAGVGTLSNHGGVGTLRNHHVVPVQHGTRRRSRSRHRAGSDSGLSVTKVIKSSLQTPRPVHRLLVVSTPSLLFYFILFFAFHCAS